LAELISASRRTAIALIAERHELAFRAADKKINYPSDIREKRHAYQPFQGFGFAGIKSPTEVR
jgi:hypothetical protein